MKLSIGTRIYNTGDMCNMSHFGAVTAIKPANKFSSETYEITPDEDSDRAKPYFVNECMVSEKYLGHCGTRFSTEASYLEYRAGQINAFKKARGEKI